MASRWTLICSRALVLRPQLATAGCTAVSRQALSTTGPARTGEKIPDRNAWELVDVKTHTGQIFEKGDFRLARFEGKSKEVNTRFAIDLIDETTPLAVAGRATFCDGGDGPLGHPRVFINLDQPGNHACGYCGLRFYQDTHHKH